MTTFTAKETAVLTALIAAYEHSSDGWGTVYIDNAKHGLSDRSFAGVASSLTAKGVYNDIGDCFCEVKLDALDPTPVEQQGDQGLNATMYAKEERNQYIANAEAAGWSRSKARRAWRAVHGSMYA